MCFLRCARKSVHLSPMQNDVFRMLERVQRALGHNIIIYSLATELYTTLYKLYKHAYYTHMSAHKFSAFRRCIRSFLLQVRRGILSLIVVIVIVHI